MGLAVTSFYHPFFLAFNVVLVAVCFAVWLVWRRGAISAAVALSHAKHDTAQWLESVGASNGFYKSHRHLSFAMDRSEQATAHYVDAHKRYFRYSFAQTLGYFLIYAFASAALLALGGNLILRGELSIGQLVAAELILSGVFYGIYQLGYYLDMFYDMVASSEELSLLLSIPQENVSTTGTAPKDGSFRLRDVEMQGARLNFALDSGELVVSVVEPGVDKLIARALKRHAQPSRGLVSVGGSELGSFDMYLLRSAVTVLDRPTIVEVSIREYLTLADPQMAGEQMMQALEQVGLNERIAMLPQGLDTQLASSGAPLSIAEVMKLKLANSLISQPKVLVLSQLFDMMPTAVLQSALTRLKQSGTTVLLFTGRPEVLGADAWMWIGHREQRRFASHDLLADYLRTREHDHA